MKKKKIKSNEEVVQLGKAELVESIGPVIQEANGDTLEHVTYRTPPRMDIYTTVPKLPQGEWYGDKLRRQRQRANDAYWKKK